MQSIDFHGLPRSMQERFVEAIEGRTEPTPLAEARTRSREAWLWWGAIGASTVALIMVWRLGYGDPAARFSLQSRAMNVAYFVPIALLCAAIARLFVLSVRAHALPYPRGIYAFPASVVDARTSSVHVHPIAELRAVEQDGRTIKVSFDDASYVFEGTDVNDAAARAAKLSGARDEASTRGPDSTLLFTLDPLHKARISSPLGRKGSIALRTPRWHGLVWLVGPLVGLLVAPLARSVRNRGSDDAMFRRVRSEGSIAAYHAYLDRGGTRHRDETIAVLLPRAELAEASAVGTVAAIEAFAATHPSSAIADEIEAARRKTMLAELDGAIRMGTLVALQDFVRRHPDHGVEPELRAAIHALFAPALDTYRRQPPDKNVLAFAERLFAYSEGKAHEGAPATTVQIRFERTPSKSLGRADAMVERHNWFVGEASYPSHWFSPDHDAPREHALAETLRARLTEALGEKVFRFAEGAPIVGAAPTTVTTPTLIVSHATEWPQTFDGRIEKPRGIWVDLVFKFEATFLLPDGGEPLTFSMASVQRIPQSVLDENKQGGVPGAWVEAKVYGWMANEAYAQMSTRYLQNFLPSAAPKIVAAHN